MSGTTNITYTGVSGLSTLEELYFFNPTDLEIEKLFKEMSKTDYEKLNTLKISGGFVGFGNIGERSTKKNKSSFTCLQSNGNNMLDLLTLNTKKALEIVDLSNNNISISLDFSTYEKITTLYLFNNNLILVPNLYSGDYERVDLGGNTLETLSFPDKTTISNLYIDENNLTTLKGILNHGVKSCWATGMLNLDFGELTNDEKDALKNIQLYIDSSKYALAFPTVNTIIPTETTDEEFIQIKNSTNVQGLNLSGCKKISSMVLAEILPTLTGLKILVLDGCNISSIDCLSNLRLLWALSIRNTDVCDLSPLFGKGIKMIRLNDTSKIIDYYELQDEDYKLNLKKFFEKINEKFSRS